MSKNTSDAIKLFGTDEPVEPLLSLNAGPVSCQFDQGALRFIKVHGREAIRNIAFVVRDKDWGTYPPRLSNIKIQQNTSSFSISFDAVCKDALQEIRYKANISGAANGTITFTGNYTATTDFVTNRTGFVVLHPLNGVAGHPVTIESVNGDILQAEFPELVDPVQPFKNIRTLTHEVLPGVRVSCRMTGDAFEMEDHRQWNDASYKTYVRPLALPWPYTIKASVPQQQRVVLSIIGDKDKNQSKSTQADANQCVITIDKVDNPVPMPGIGIGLEPQHLNGAVACQDLLTKLTLKQLVLWHDTREHDSNHLLQAANLWKNLRTDIELQAVIPDNDYKLEIATLARQCKDAGIGLSAIHVTPAIYLGSIMPGPSWPKVTSLKTLYEEVRKQFPGVAVGGGMLSFFPELNRHRPPVELLDFISHASNTITHACDDISVTENLEALPYIIKTCRSFAANTPYHVGPSSIGMRFNPYGSKTMDNPNNTRIAMARIEPRQRGLINAAWTVGYAAHLARGGIDCINLHAPTGEFGIFNHKETWAQPGFDNTPKLVFPVYHVLAGLTAAAGKSQLLTHSSMSREVEVFGYEDHNDLIIWIANLTSDARNIKINGINNANGKVSTLSIETFEICTNDTDGFEQTTTQTNLSNLNIGPYAVVKIQA